MMKGKEHFVYLNEIRHLMPSIRTAILRGDRIYEGQTGPVRIEAEHERRSVEQRVGIGHQHGFGVKERTEHLLRHFETIGRHFRSDDSP